MAPSVELSGIAVVFAGSFNPAIFHPQWFVLKELLPGSAADAAVDHTLVGPDVAVFTADWLGVQVTQQQAVFSTVDEGRTEDLRDVAGGVVGVLSETPVDAVGINTDVHFRAGSEEAWHLLGDMFVPKSFWEPMFQGDIWRKRPDGLGVGVRTVTVEGWREDVNAYVRVEAAPSIRISPNGVYIGINSHYQLSEAANARSNGYEAGVLLAEQWDATRDLEANLLGAILEAV